MLERKRKDVRKIYLIDNCKEVYIYVHQTNFVSRT